MELMSLIQHPELMDRETLYELRSTLALHPYYQTARLLMLQNLYLLHDAAFDEELRRAALYITDRRVIFQMIEAAHYQWQDTVAENDKKDEAADPNRTLDLIDSFLGSIPSDELKARPQRKPTPADAAIDYVAYLLDTESMPDNGNVPQLRGQSLIDTFLEEEQGRIQLSDTPVSDTPPAEANNSDEEETPEEEFFTETLARIYIRQGRYQKALDIIGRLNQQMPQKNAYFADQMRFLEKLIINSNKKQN